MKGLLLIVVMFFSVPSMAAIQCGGYHLSINDREGLVRINGELVTSQKVKYVGATHDEANAIWQMGLMPARDGYNYGFELIKDDGKAWLNVELIFADMDAPRIIGSFPCHRVK
ncbi:hypothetical protein MU985_003155 [Salmonella enterica]|nr:hypothetical protein [Salmonella enterica]